MQHFEYDDDDRSLRRIMLGILSDDEDYSREMLDDAIFSIENLIDPIKFPNEKYVMLTYGAAIFAVVLSLAFLTYNKPISDTIMVVSLILAILPIVALWGWSRFQYGKGKLRKPRTAVYGEASAETAAALDRFFTYLQRDSTKAYYRRRNGEKRYLDPNFSYGPQRILLLSASPTVRGLYLLPGAIRIKAPIKIDADPEAVITALTLKPEPEPEPEPDDAEAVKKTKREGSSGSYSKYPYENAAIGLMGDPRLLQLDLREPDTAITSIAEWIVKWFDAHPDAGGSGPRANSVRTRDCARKIYARLREISRPSPD